MKYLLDTHICLWLAREPELLPPSLLVQLESRSNDLFVSVASLWEITIKSSLGKLQLERNGISQFLSIIRAMDLDLLPIRTGHLQELEALPFHHRDPFDRMIVAQCRSERMLLVTKDRDLRSYDLQTIWN